MSRGVAPVLVGRGPCSEQFPVLRGAPQLRVRSHRPHSPLLQPHHGVRAGGRGDAVGDEQPAATVRGAKKRVGDVVLGEGVQAGEGVVEHEEMTLAGERAGQAQALGLTTGQRGVGTGRGVAVGKTADETVGVRGAGGPPDPGGGGAAGAEGDGVLHRPTQQGRAFEGVDDRPAQLTAVQLRQGYPVEQHLSVVRIRQPPGHRREQ